jgi:hypothetical protein
VTIISMLEVSESFETSATYLPKYTLSQPWIRYCGNKLIPNFHTRISDSGCVFEKYFFVTIISMLEVSESFETSATYLPKYTLSQPRIRYCGNKLIPNFHTRISDSCCVLQNLSFSRC